MDCLARIAENRILEAMEAGLFNDLPGKGKPLKLEDDSQIPPELRLAYKVLKMADCLPPELELHKEILQLKDLLAALPDEAEKLRQMRRLNFLVMKLRIMRKVSPLLEEHEIYTPKILERLESGRRQAGQDSKPERP